MNFIKKNIQILSVLLTVLLIASCSNEESMNNSEEIQKELSLISPDGKKIANSQGELINLYLDNVGITKSDNDIEIIDIRYSNSDNYSFGVVDLSVGENLSSMLVLLDISDNYTVLSDSDGLRFVEKGNFSLDGIPSENILKSNTQKSLGFSEVVYVCNGGCCGWSQTGDDAYNCGCPAVVSTSLTLTTSDGCAIQVIEK
ncbi:hypothetical protein [uncultured Polaribacter sp.]|uniref:hypothetical protein n=1 Tax=uncultured Polaribacter sp. TaxID=174711 RepID=UPI00260CD4F6|nr:hypothetical protein [uncultured Polaribacter sp.]